jgi:hypothetical protein
MKIRETFHYGSDRTVTDFPIERLSPFEIVRVFAGSVYIKGDGSNPDEPAAIRALMNREEASLGWCRYVIIED